MTKRTEVFVSCLLFVNRMQTSPGLQMSPLTVNPPGSDRCYKVCDRRIMRRNTCGCCTRLSVSWLNSATREIKSFMWGVAASILIASVALSIGEYWLNNKDSALGKAKKQEPVKLLEELAKTATKLKAGRRK